MLQKFYKNKRVLITGDTGFKGSWLANVLLAWGAEVQGYSLDTISTPSHFSLSKLPYPTVYADILDKKKLSACLKKFKPEVVFHLAAQSLVPESYQNPFNNFEVNFNGTLNLLDAIKENGKIKTIIIITTDKVYRNISEKKRNFTETDALGSFDPYSASKAAAEIVSESYYTSFFASEKIGLATARSGNVIGGGDWARDRLVPDIIRSWRNKKELRLRNPNGIRPWQHVLETVYGYLLLAERLHINPAGFSGAWNFGPAKGQLKEVGKIISSAQEYLSKLTVKKDPPSFYEAPFLALNSHKAFEKLGWKNKLSFEKTMQMTFKWYKAFYEEKKLMTQYQIAEYLKQW